MSTISGYKIVREIGHGGMSTVYLAIQKSVNRYVALKVMSSHLVDDETYAERFLSEARIAARFRHPNIISVYDVSLSEGVPYIAMEYVPGGELDTARIKSMGLTARLSVLVQIADALGFLHKQNFVHRDIKPGNILFREDDSVVLTDFGVARDQTARKHQTLTGYIVGTPHYLSPEQAQGKPVDARSDLYSLGVLMFRMLTTRLPYVADDAISVCTMHVNADIPDLPSEYAQFDPVIKKAMAKAPEDRHQSADEFIDHLISVTGSDTARLLKRSVEGVALEAIKAEDQSTATREQVRLAEIGLGTRIQPTVPTASAIRRFSRRYLGLEFFERLFRRRGGDAPSYRRRVFLGSLVVISILVIAAVVVNLDWGPPEEDSSQVSRIEEPEPTPLPERVEPPAGDDSPAISGGPSEIESLLAEGQRAQDQGIYVQPEDISALSYYRRVLAIDPENRRAREGLEAIARVLEDLAETSLEQGDDALAEQFLLQAKLTGHSDPDRITRLEEMLRGGGVDPEQDDRIAQLLSRGYDFLEKYQLTRPAEANAVSEFNQVLSLEPGNADAKRGLELVGVRYLELANGELRAGNLDQAEAYLASADQFAPGAPGADAVRQALQAHQQAALAVREEEPPPAARERTSAAPSAEIVPARLPQINAAAGDSLDALYKQAEQAMRSGDRMRAYAFYKEVWRRDPDFGRAGRRLSSGAGSYINVASREILTGDLEAARENLSVAMALDASHPKFDSVRRDYLTAVESRTGSRVSSTVASSSLDEIRIMTIMEDAQKFHSRFEVDISNRRAAERARERYLEVLAMNGSYAPASNGLQRLLEDLLGAARLSLAESRMDDARWYLVTARQINPRHPELAALEERIN